MAVVVREEEFRLPVVAIPYLGNQETESQEPLSERMDVPRCPVEPHALVILRFERRACSLIEPEIQPLVMDHTSDEPAVLSHGPIHPQPKPVHPEAQTPFQIDAGYDGNARIDEHLQLLVASVAKHLESATDHRRRIRVGENSPFRIILSH